MLRETPVSHVAGVGPAKQRGLAELGIFTVYELLHHFPYRYEDRRVQPLALAQHGDRITVAATVEGIANVRWVNRKSVLTARLLVDGQHRVTGVWFNQHYLKQKLTDGRLVVVTGKYDRDRRTIAISQTEFDGRGQRDDHQAWHPLYRATKTLGTAQIAQIVRQALEQFGGDVEEILPFALVEKYRLISHRDAVWRMHLPESSEDLRQARRRLAFEEFFLFQLQLQWFRRSQSSAAEGVARRVPNDVIEQFADSLSYPMTGAQLRACEAICRDLAKPQSMHRLLQGDVGSGKTWVALFAAYAVARCGAQTALMAPTEILAEQHFAEATERLERLGLRVALVTGSTPEKQRQVQLTRVRQGEVDLLIGTHALLTEDVQFADLGLVITDEQHRFGVSQRAILRGKGRAADVLYLSATPIPRTLALAIYGDLDVSTLDELPAGRRPIETVWLPLRQADKAIRRVRQELAKGRQAYVVAPLVEQSADLDVLSATELFEQLSQQFAGHSVSLLHGRMAGRDKDDVMRRFVAGEIQVLVSTTVIEVGINVPNATVMLVYHAERFGLSQLHQLRGRVGRGTHESTCILLADPGNDVAKERLRTMTETTDGFAIAERDLELRGPGEFLGVRQSGLPEFTVGDLARDFKVMEVARDEAREIISDPSFWLEPRFEALRRAIGHVPDGSYWKD